MAASLRKHVLIFAKKSIYFNNKQLSFIRDSSTVNYLLHRKFSNASIEYYTKNRDPASLFFKEDVQKLLKKLTRINLNKVYRQRRLEDKKIEEPVYKFMTDDELKATLQEANDKALEMIQMPPVVRVRDEIDEVLSKDPALQGYDTAKFVFTDITYGISNRDRLIVIREPDGTLKKADWDTRHRMNQLYFPRNGCELATPLMFNDDYLKSLLERKEYEFILDRACIQFEPDDPNYQRITSLTYQYNNEHNDFEMLRSTRHFGPMCFYLVWFKNIDNLLLELIETSHISDANLLFKLNNQLHGDSDLIYAEEVQLKSEDDTKLIEWYIKEKSAKKGQLELALQSYKDFLKRKLETEQGIQEAHGFA